MESNQQLTSLRMPELPIDIAECIVELVTDIPDLLNLCLSNKALYNVAQRYLYREVWLADMTTDQASKSIKLATILARRVDLARQVRKLDFALTSGSMQPGLLLTGLGRIFFRALKNTVGLVSLKLFVMPETIAFLASLESTSSQVEELTILATGREAADTKHFSFLRGWSNLRSLDVSFISMEETPPNVLSWLPSQSQAVLPKVKNLSGDWSLAALTPNRPVDEFRAGISQDCLDELDFAGQSRILQPLSMSTGPLLSFVMVMEHFDLHTISHIGERLDALKALTVEVRHIHNVLWTSRLVSNGTAPSVPMFSSLATFSIIAQQGWQDYGQGRHFVPLLRVLNARTRSLSKLVFTPKHVEQDFSGTRQVAFNKVSVVLQDGAEADSWEIRIWN